MSKNNKKYICINCGRSDFANGHALGGHLKYCNARHNKKNQIPLSKPLDDNLPKFENVCKDMSKIKLPCIKKKNDKFCMCKNCEKKWTKGCENSVPLLKIGF